MYVCTNFLFYRFFPTKKNIKSWKLDKQIKKSLVKLIERRKENCSSKERLLLIDEKSPKDLLGLMIEAASNNNNNVTVDDIVEECKSFFFAGKQTTSNLLTWTTILLAMHPHWQVKARDEVIKMCGSRDLPTKDHVLKLKTVSIRQPPPHLSTLLCYMRLIFGPKNINHVLSPSPSVYVYVSFFLSSQ
jgi:PHYB activation tagged suppressor 1